MADFVILRSDETIENIVVADSIGDVAIPDGMTVLPLVIEEIDTSTGPDTVVSPWVDTVEPTRFLRSHTIRDKTAGELDAEDQARVDALLLNSGVMRALAKALFLVGNEVRVLNGENPITASQFKTFLKGLIR